GLGGWMKPWHVLGERLTGWLAHRILTVSKRSYDIRRKREGFGAKRLQVFYNAIDTERFAAEVPPPPPPLVLGIAARLIPLKRVDRVISLLAALRKRGMEVQLRIAGDGPERERLEDLVGEKKLESQIEFLGLVHDMPAFYRSIHILVLASETEDLPMVLIEAMAAGRGVIASDVGGISELTEGGIGMLVSDWETESLAEEAWNFIQNIDWKACHAHNSRFAREGFDERAYAVRLMELYKGL
ncbi:MAG: glycosyltransferase, partial [Bacteroidia bacterium]